MSDSKKMVGMIVPTLDNSFFSALVSQTCAALHEAGFRMVVMDSGHDADRERSYLRELSNMGADGIICVSGLSELQEGIVPDELPLLWVDRVPRSVRQIPWVANDDAAATATATDFLCQKGCRNILLLPGYLAEHQESPRILGYRKALAMHGVEFNPSLILNRPGKKSTEQETFELIREILAEDIAVDGIITSSDRSAFGAITAFRSVGYFVPEDVRLICFDNSSYSAMASPSLTSLDRKVDALAQKACAIMKRQMAGEKDIPIENVVDVTLEKRASTR
ncbi:MAG: substrate-binding domain-containing protein [Selenomonas sp.]|nr:substrate-binding domain-containing protein [Selenomonas sp.]